LSSSFEPEHGFFVGFSGPNGFDEIEAVKWRITLALIALCGAKRHSYRIWRDRRRPDGIASTMRHSPIITIPMNSKAKASTAILPQYADRIGGAR